MVASADGAWALAADKFGDVSVAAIAATTSATPSTAEQTATVEAVTTSESAAAVSGVEGGVQSAVVEPQKAVQLMGHYNATITSLTMSPDGSQLVTTDRDHKARINVFPAEPLKVTLAMKCGGWAKALQTYNGVKNLKPDKFNDTMKGPWESRVRGLEINHKVMVLNTLDM